METPHTQWDTSNVAKLTRKRRRIGGRAAFWKGFVGWLLTHEPCKVSRFHDDAQVVEI